MSANGGVFAPDTQEREQAAHACGVCRTPWGVTNPACPNAARS